MKILFPTLAVNWISRQLKRRRKRQKPIEALVRLFVRKTRRGKHQNDVSIERNRQRKSCYVFDWMRLDYCCCCLRNQIFWVFYFSCMVSVRKWDRKSDLLPNGQWPCAKYVPQMRHQNAFLILLHRHYLQRSLVMLSIIYDNHSEVPRFIYSFLFKNKLDFKQMPWN